MFGLAVVAAGGADRAVLRDGVVAHVGRHGSVHVGHVAHVEDTKGAVVGERPTRPWAPRRACRCIRAGMR